MSTPWLLTLSFFVVFTLLAWAITRFTHSASINYREAFTKKARFNLEDMFLFFDAKVLFYLNGFAIIIIPLIIWLILGNPALAILALITTAFLPKYIYRYLRARRYRRFEMQLPDAILMMAGALRAGSSLPMAFSNVAQQQSPPLSQEFDLVLREQRLGVSLDDALQHMNERIPSLDFGLVVSAIRIGREVGGNLAETLERLAATLRQKAAMEGKIRALTSQGKLQGIVVGALPLVLMLILFQMEPEAMAPLLHTPMGWAVIAVIVTLEIMGILMIRRIVNIDV